MAGDTRPLALVTGASGGIGEELARVLAAEGHDLVLSARREAELARVAGELEAKHGIRARVVAADLATPGGADALFGAVEAEGLTVDVLVNNAGFGVHGPFAETPEARELALLQVNVVALTVLTKRFLPGMIARGRGRILNVASTAAFVPGPFMAVYYASKAYVLSLSQALAEETRGTGVQVTALCPGATRTAFATEAGLTRSRLFRLPNVLDAAAVARAGYLGMKAGKQIVIPGAANRLLIGSIRVAPRTLLGRVTRTLHDPKAMT